MAGAWCGAVPFSVATHMGKPTTRHAPVIIHECRIHACHFDSLDLILFACWRCCQRAPNCSKGSRCNRSVAISASWVISYRRRRISCRQRDRDWEYRQQVCRSSWPRQVLAFFKLCWKIFSTKTPYVKDRKSENTTQNKHATVCNAEAGGTAGHRAGR